MAVMTLRVEGSRALFDMQASLHKTENLEVQTVYPELSPEYMYPYYLIRSYLKRHAPDN